METVKCIICGKEFIPTNRGGKPRVVCSDKCRVIRIRELNRKTAQKNRERRNEIQKETYQRERIRRQMPKSNAKNLSALQKQAQKHGMSYGQWVALQEYGGR